MNRYSPGYLLTTDSEVYRCIGQKMVVVSMFAANGETTTARQVTIQHVPADSTPDDSFSLANTLNISAKGSTTFAEPVIMDPGDAIYARASVIDKVVLTIYVIPYSDFILGRI